MNLILRNGVVNCLCTGKYKCCTLWNSISCRLSQNNREKKQTEFPFKLNISSCSYVNINTFPTGANCQNKRKVLSKLKPKKALTGLLVGNMRSVKQITSKTGRLYANTTIKSMRNRLLLIFWKPQLPPL